LPTKLIENGRPKQRGRRGRTRTTLITRPPAGRTSGYPIIRQPPAPRAAVCPVTVRRLVVRVSTPGTDDANGRTVNNR